MSDPSTNGHSLPEAANGAADGGAKGRPKVGLPLPGDGQKSKHKGSAKQPGDIADEAPPPEPKPYRLLVDSEGRAKQLKLWSAAPPHMLSFHLNYIAFACSFLSTFAAAPLIPIIRDDLNLTRTSASVAAIASITGTCFSRVAAGSLNDAFGPRISHALILSFTSSAAFSMSQVTTAAGFVIARLFIGFSLACFVCCQFWTSIMFSPTIVGTANAVAGGLGNSGGGWTQIIMPYLTTGIAANVPTFTAWRWAFFVPGAAQVVISIIVLAFAQDLPAGNYADLKKKGKQQETNTKRELWVCVRNYRTWILVLCYGFSFGVELTMNNNLATYLNNQFGKSLLASGNFSSVFGLMNIIARPTGGFCSDYFAKRFGMRGRLWWMWCCLATGGALCIGVGLSQNSFNQTMAFIAFFAFFIQAGCGAAFSVVPFVSRRALGLVCGCVGAGGNAGGAILQAAFFTAGGITANDSFKYMGIMSMLVTSSVWLMHFPMWGGMALPRKQGVTEEDYYYADWTEDERALGKHFVVMKFANESKSQRGFMQLKAEAEEAAAAREQV